MYIPTYIKDGQYSVCMYMCIVYSVYNGRKQFFQFICTITCITNCDINFLNNPSTVIYLALLFLQAFRFFPKDRKMALAQLNSVDDAVMALVKLHNYQLSDTSHLR